jgi:hypothetical protein
MDCKYKHIHQVNSYEPFNLSVFIYNHRCMSTSTAAVTRSWHFCLCCRSCSHQILHNNRSKRQDQSDGRASACLCSCSRAIQINQTCPLSGRFHSPFAFLRAKRNAFPSLIHHQLLQPLSATRTWSLVRGAWRLPGGRFFRVDEKHAPRCLIIL